MMCVSTSRDFVIEEEDQSLFKEVTDDIAFALYNMELEDKRKQVEDLLEKERNLLRTLIDNLPDIIYVKDTESRFVTGNNAVAHLMGAATPDELIGKTDFDFYPEEIAHKFYNDEQEIIRSGQEIIQREEPVIDSESNNRWLSTTKVPLRDSNGKIIGIVGIGRDITQIKQSEDELRNEMDKAQRYLNIAGVIVIIVDNNQNVTLINKKGCEILGYEENEIIGKNWYDNFIPERIKKKAKTIFTKLMAGDNELNEYYENPVLTKNGEERVIAWHDVFLRDKEGRITGILSSGEDITEKRRLEKQLIQAQKMEAIGTLAGGVAHDFNNLLSVIIGYSDFILTKLDKENHITKYIEEISKAGQRAASLTQQLLAFSRKQTLQPTALDLNTLVTEMEKMLRRLIGEDIELIAYLEPKLRPVKADHGQVEQIIMNLTVNARDAMPMGGKLTIKTENVTIDESYCKIYSYARSGTFVCLSVSDTGVGMDKETISHIFEPFFTTKEVGKGTGLGLSVVFGILKQHNGWINVYSEPGQGSSFRVYLESLFVEGKEETEEEISLQELHGHGERVLLVEDEEMLREFATGVLCENGYTVFTANNVKEALDLYEREKGEFQLVFSDVVLPDKTGIELVDHLLSKKPELKVLLASGYLNGKSQWTKIQERGFNFVQKPYTLEGLLKAVTKAIKQY